jgi:hypothetical protein
MPAAGCKPAFFYLHDFNFAPVDKKPERIFCCPGTVMGLDRKRFHAFFLWKIYILWLNLIWNAMPVQLIMRYARLRRAEEIKGE